MENGKKKMKNKFKSSLGFCVSAICLFTFALNLFAQIEQPPAPSAPRAAKVPPVQTKILPNNLTVATVERKNVPLVTVSLLIKSGAAVEDKDGLANMTAKLLTQGTKTRTATQIAEQIEFLGGRISSSANWNSTVISINVASDKLEKALAIMSDVVLNPAFAPKEIALYKTQTIDDLTVALKQPSSLASFVASRYTFKEHSVNGTPESLNKIIKSDILKFYQREYKPENSVLIFAGDVTKEKTDMLSKQFFGVWKKASKVALGTEMIERFVNETGNSQNSEKNVVNKILVVDLPNSGQAAVSYTKKLANGRIDYSDETKNFSVSKSFYPATVANTVLGGGYSARLNQEIRIKRGLSYGARSSIDWRQALSDFATRTQTKNESAAEVAEIVAAEIDKLGIAAAEQPELIARKLTLTGDFGRDLETTDGLAERLVELYAYDLSPNELNSFMSNVQDISAEQIKNFAAENLKGGNIIIVGDAKIFMDDLKKRFPNQQIEVIAANDLDLNRDDLRKKL